MQIWNKDWSLIELKERLKMIEEENDCINHTILGIEYILRHLVYDEPEQNERVILGEFILQLVQDIKLNVEGVGNVVDYLISN